MNNKTLKSVVALVATVLLVCSCAFAATIGDVTYDAETGALSVPFASGEGATKAMLLVKNAQGEIVAAAQFNNLTEETVAFNETIDTTKVANGDTLTVSVGDNAADSTLADTKAVDVPAYYTVTIDGEATKVAAGTLISELLPAKESYQDETTVYTFDGWYVGEEKLAADATVAADVEIQSVFTSAPRKYVVKFVDEDGTELKSEEVAYGETPVAPEAPSKEANEKYTYEFAGWTPEIAAVAGDATYTATYTETARAYTVTWVVEGVETTETYAYGAMPEYKGETPVKAGDAQYSYNFVGWGEIAEVTGDATYTAQFEEVVNNYTITYVVEGVETTETLAYGATPAPADPVKAEDENFTYEFAGWDPALTTVTGDATYTATFNAVAKEPEVPAIKVTFINGAESIEVESVDGVVTAPEAPTTPTPGEDAVITAYEFVGWTTDMGEDAFETLEAPSYEPGDEITAEEGLVLYAKYIMYNLEENVVKYGDIDGDGRIKNADIDELSLYIDVREDCGYADWINVVYDDIFGSKYGDIDGDGRIKNADIDELSLYIDVREDCSYADIINTEVFFINID